ncbi:MAG: PilW family protein [Nitrospinales bacterium]
MSLPRHLSDQKGISLPEVMVVSIITTVVLGAAIATFVHQEKIFHDQGDLSKIKASGRSALQLLVADLRKAGYGFPAGQGIASADDRSIAIRANFDNVFSWITSNVIGGSSFTVKAGDAAKFAVNDKIVLYNINDGSWETATIQAVDTTTDTITATAAFANTYLNLSPTIVNKYHDIVFSLDNANNRVVKSIDGGDSTPLTGDVAANGLGFDYRDNANTALATPVGNLSAIRQINVTLNMRHVKNSNAAITLETEVHVRNMGS